jgi:hypothetical protein
MIETCHDARRFGKRQGLSSRIEGTTRGVTMKHLHLTSELISKIDEVEFLYTQDRMNAIRDFRNEPGCVRYVERENLRAVMLPSIPNPNFNRILLSGPVSIVAIGEVLSL